MGSSAQVMGVGVTVQNNMRRFGGLDRLYGADAVGCLTQCHVMVIGVGGVGSWAVEGLARSGVGHLTLIDLDHVSESNINRQIQATDSTLGQSKIVALRDRVLTYAPACAIELIDDFFQPSQAEALLTQAKSQSPLVVLDCCDQTSAKVSLAVHSKRQRIPFALAGSAGGKKQPWQIKCADLRASNHDPLLAKVRAVLRKDYNFSRSRNMGVPVFFSPEPAVKKDISSPASGLNCAGYGSVVTVTATMGFQMAAWAMNKLLSSAD